LFSRGRGGFGGGMRIAQIAPLAESVQLSHYGGTERVVSWLSDELIGLGDMSRCLQAAARKPRPSCCGFAQTVAAEPSADRVSVPAPVPALSNLVCRHQGPRVLRTANAMSKGLTASASALTVGV